MRAGIRFVTAIFMIGICGFAAAEGWNIVRFSLAMLDVGPSEKGTDIAKVWVTVPDVASAALQAELKEKVNPSDPKAATRRREALSALLSIKPLSAVDWLSLSGMQWATGQPMKQILQSLNLSMLTGPNEGYVMPARGIFGASLWESLSPDLKRHVASDLTAKEIIGNPKFRTILSAKPAGVRNEIRAAMLATGLSPNEVEQRLGF